MDNNNLDSANKQTELKTYFFKELLPMVIIVVLVCKFIIGLATIESGSMEPTLMTGTIHVQYLMPYTFGNPVPERGDIITFQISEHDVILTKRVVGLPGDEITIFGGDVYLNGEKFIEEYLPEQGITYPADNGIGHYVVPEGCVFVLGDNRMDSVDSRFFSNPYVSISCITGRVLF